MIERSPACGMGTTHVCGASAVHHFSFGRYQSQERLEWGLLRVLNRIHLEPGGKRELYPLGGMEVVIFVEAGAIALHYGDHRVILHHGEVGAIALGLGGDYGFSNVERSKSVQVVLDGGHGYGCVTQGSTSLGALSCASGDGIAILDELVLEVIPSA